jgi:hypothetical protein
MPLVKGSVLTPPKVGSPSAHRPTGSNAEPSREGVQTSSPAASRWHGLGEVTVGEKHRQSLP